MKPERDRQKDAAGKQHWWRFLRNRPELYAAIARLDRCLVTAAVSKYLSFSFQRSDRIFSHKLFILPLNTFTSFAALQSRGHGAWTWALSSRMKQDLNYSATDCFETFPFPTVDPRAIHAGLETIGASLYEARARYMIDTSQGLTDTYNRLKDPSDDDPRVRELRALHEQLDRAVLDAYGWSDLPVPPYCPRTQAERAALESFEEEIVDRLFLLNATRAAAERPPTPTSSASRPRTRRS